MDRESKPVDILGADTETLEKDSAFPNAYAFYVRLSDEPDAVWQRYLAEWRNALYTMQREITVVGNRLRLVFVYGDDIQSCANYAAHLVELINKRIEEYNIQVDLQEKREMTMREKEHHSISARDLQAGKNLNANSATLRLIYKLKFNHKPKRVATIKLSLKPRVFFFKYLK